MKVKVEADKTTMVMGIRLPIHVVVDKKYSGTEMHHFIELLTVSPLNKKLTTPYFCINMYETIHQNEKG